MKKNIIKLIVTIVLVLIGVACYMIFMQEKTSDDSGIVYFTLIDIDGNVVIDDTLTYEENDTLFEVISRNYEVESEKSQYGQYLYSIDEVKTNTFDTYLALYVDDKYAETGISFIKLYDKMHFKVIETKIGD